MTIGVLTLGLRMHTVEFDESLDWIFIRVCRNCESVLGTVRCVLALKKCPECGVPLFPLEHHTRSIPVAPVRLVPKKGER